jgi:phosphoribosylamine--glycine ligase
VKVLLLGGGGREHAIGWKLAQSPLLSGLVSAPGNPGLAEVGTVVPHLAITDTAAVVQTALAEAVDLVVIGPEAPLAAGVVDALAEAGVRAFGPTRAGARLEASKAFAKDVMSAHCRGTRLRRRSRRRSPHRRRRSPFRREGRRPGGR